MSPSGGDILSMSPTSLQVRLMRKFSVVCDWDFSNPTQPEVWALNFQGRTFDAGDSVFIYADNYQNRIDDDAWIQAQVTQVNTGDSCPQNGEAATRMRFTGQGALFVADTIGLGAPMRSYDTYTFGSTTFVGDTYLGRQQGLGFMMPVVGPIRSTGGVTFEYLRCARQHVTTTATDVRQIVVTVRTGEGVINPLNQEVTGLHHRLGLH